MAQRRVTDVKDEPFPYSVNLEIYPPNSRHTQDGPETRFLAQRPDR